MNTHLQPVFIREQVMRATRRFFEEKSFHEVITPVFNRALPVEPNIYPFSTQWKTHDTILPLYLSTSPESGIKKMMARGIGDCFAIGKCFRNLEGSGSKHNPEFLMLEWYRENARYEQIIADTKEYILFVKKEVDIYKREILKQVQDDQKNMLGYQGMSIDLSGEWPVLSLVDLFKDHAGLDMEEIVQDVNLYNRAQEKGYNVEGATWSGLFDQILVNEIEASFPNTPFFIKDFPTRISPLCTPNKAKPYLADRFEFYICGMELANGNNENTDYNTIEKVFKEEQQDRAKKELLNSELDTDFINALKTMSAKNYAGIGLGIDRLAMIMADVETIQEIELLHI